MRVVRANTVLYKKVAFKLYGLKKTHVKSKSNFLSYMNYE